MSMSEIDPTKIPPNDSALEVARLFGQAIQETPYAWHGTSVEAVLYLAAQGSLPASGSYGSEFFMAPEHLAPGIQKEHAMSYAGWNAEKVYVSQKLPFEPKNKERFMYMWDDKKLLNKFIKQEAAGYEITEQDVLRLIKEGFAQRKGVLLGVSEKVTIDYEAGEYLTDDQVSILLPKGGLPLQYVTGIEPLGQYEWDQLVALQDSVQPQSM